MAYYRILKRVDKGGPVGGLCQFEWLDEGQRARLVEVGAISRLAAPPLAELPGWSKRAGRLANMGIDTAEQYLEADAAEVARAFRVKRATAERWKDELMNWLIIPVQERRG